MKVNQVLNEYRPKVLGALTSEEGVLLRMNRSIQVEGVFGVLKEEKTVTLFMIGLCDKNASQYFGVDPSRVLTK